MERSIVVNHNIDWRLPHNFSLYHVWQHYTLNQQLSDMTQVLACAPNLENCAGRRLHNLFFCLDHVVTGTSEGFCSLAISVTQEESVNRNQFPMTSSEGIGTSSMHGSHLWSACFELWPQIGQSDILCFKTVPHTCCLVLEK